MPDSRQEFLAAGLEPEVLSAVIAEVLSSLREEVTMAWIDAFTQGTWRPEQHADVEVLLELERQQLADGRRRKPTGMGIDLDLSRDDHAALLARLAPYSIHSEAWSGTTSVYSCSDVGDHAWFALTPAQVKASAVGLESAGYVFQEVITLSH